mgnify:CR=1 FL=1
MLIECKEFEGELWVRIDRVQAAIKSAVEVNNTNWPFPPSTGAIPWTAKQIQEYAQKQRDELGDALL